MINQKNIKQAEEILSKEIMDNLDMASEGNMPYYHLCASRNELGLCIKTLEKPKKLNPNIWDSDSIRINSNGSRLKENGKNE